jgi:hypothetical protein
MNNRAPVASLAALIKQRLGVEAVLKPGKTGQFDVIVDGRKVAERGGNWITRQFGAGYPNINSIVDQIAALAHAQ